MTFIYVHCRSWGNMTMCSQWCSQSCPLSIMN
nr:MAG TPA: hypothetical protein [Bacteriophage sp.]